MARLKFLVFSLAALGLFGAHLFLFSPALSARAVEQARSGASRAPAPVGAMLEARRSALQRAALVVASDAHTAWALPARGGRGEAPSAARLEALRGQLSGAIPVELRNALVLALVNDAGAVMVRGSGSAGEAPADFEAQALSSAGLPGTTRLAFGAPHLFISVPVPVLERGDSVAVGHVLVGAPLFTQDMLDGVAREAQLDGVAVMKDGEVLMAAGAQKELARKLGPKAVPEKTEVVEKGQVAALGPFKLPILTAGDVQGGSAPLWISSRRAVASTPYEVVAIASVSPFMTALAQSQRTEIFMFGGLLVLTLVLVPTMGGAKKSRTDLEDENEDGAPSEPRYVAAPPPPPPSLAVARSEEPALAAVPEASPDDFPFTPPPSPSPFAEAEMASAGMVEAFLGSAPPVPFAPESVVPAAADPFASASAMGAHSPHDPAFNPEETRVAAIPHELLQAATRTADDFLSSNGARAAAPAPQAAPVAANADEAHYQEVFRAFMQTRESCGEPADGLTYEKFAQKLRKNREQLVAKYACRTVRFQVYVKEGKAALKATPIKDQA